MRRLPKRFLRGHIAWGSVSFPNACYTGMAVSDVKKGSSGGTSLPKARVKARGRARKDLPTC